MEKFVLLLFHISIGLSIVRHCQNPCDMHVYSYAMGYICAYIISLTMRFVEKNEKKHYVLFFISYLALFFLYSYEIKEWDIGWEYQFFLSGFLSRIYVQWFFPD